MDIREIQKRTEELFGKEDRISGPHFLAGILAEETGELAAAVRGRGSVAEEAADVIFVVLSIANLFDADVATALEKKYMLRTKDEICSTWNDVSWKKRE